ncbi:uncharacterized protein CMU_037950 [Cryptosporidium muris RN66]|uniref:START domain-containing protein n=1 Tax=Cryptosporidium muris (strain RN66) TaxID=441375 RepID=B6A939_CRYMR|nr:uncharacterized protein CMU_037950 [Cryptosporidium muris RN66]EEA04730.1 hypothetical protein CMU_037950 [Cryptosporidium muris RN66]|eukprot:XP_002139079.1 hypothetical protein [Cryptosporidium muris RN66]
MVEFKLKVEEAIKLYNEEMIWDSHLIIQELIQKYGENNVFNIISIAGEIQRRAAIIAEFILSVNKMNINEINISENIYNLNNNSNVISESTSSNIYIDPNNNDSNIFTMHIESNKSNINKLTLNINSVNTNNSESNVDLSICNIDKYFNIDGSIKKDILIGNCNSLIVNEGNNIWRHVISDNSLNLWYCLHNDSTIIELCFQGDIETDILNVLTVLYERDLYKEWIPYFKYPIKFGLSNVNEMMNKGRLHIITSIKIDIPWPFYNREVILEIWASNELHSNNRIFIYVSSIDEFGYNSRLDIEIPKPSEMISRASVLGGGFITPNSHNLTNILFKWKFDLFVRAPNFILDFFLKVFIKACWLKFRSVCINANKVNSLHFQRLTSNSEIYNFVREKLKTSPKYNNSNEV